MTIEVVVSNVAGHTVIVTTVDGEGNATGHEHLESGECLRAVIYVGKHLVISEEHPKFVTNG